MKNWKKIGQSIATGAGAALLASFASLFASSEAHAAKLIRENGETGVVTRIEGLSVIVDGVETIYDVDFQMGSAVDVYGEDLMFDFMTSDSAEAAAAAVMAELGSEEGTVLFFYGPTLFDGFHVPFLMAEREMWVWGEDGVDGGF